MRFGRWDDRRFIPFPSIRLWACCINLTDFIHKLPRSTVIRIQLGDPLLTSDACQLTFDLSKTSPEKEVREF
jgi:hypothetical protein